ncbi:hypothetical protein GCM10010168_15190 [Actinoplanes ianthinogenes]|uniref:Uncharacterized protein n=1 Tax=Actinoplanes ianthinogenes TaxID=122358 RepID=A0ABM7LZJ4_9ACTN|nr:hypothetical protein [Actinoplanes ianthinogenes]BCJ44706.1 hypothetical protein Aiant_53630 [Actinoplanes ianthinogenes]GGQ99507.1 hypothetical protein GCM10010168_15190 [Actinoplanes ianthinogenes]
MPLRRLFDLLTCRRAVSFQSPDGEAFRAVISPALCGGFVLAIDYTDCQVMADADLGTRMDDYDNPNAAEFAAADQGLTDLGLTRTEPWRAEGCPGRFVAAIADASAQLTPLACPGTTDRTEDRS